jgi:plasmid stabilization system protein ParE
MLHGFERFVVPATYGIGVVLWAVVLAVLLARLRRPPDVNRLFFVLVVVLSIDAFRTLFENAYFGAYWNAVYGVLPSELRVLLEAPTLVVVPRLVNLLAGGLVLFLVVWRWLPAAETDRIDLARRLAESAREAEQARDRYQRIVDALAGPRDGAGRFGPRHRCGCAVPGGARPRPGRAAGKAGLGTGRSRRTRRLRESAGSRPHA